MKKAEFAKRSPALLLVTGALASLALACGGDSQPTQGDAPHVRYQRNEASRPDISRPNANFMLILIDTLRADHLPCYGYNRDTAPQLCEFAEENLLFENMFSQAPSTKPAIASLFTSLYPAQHKTIRNKHILADELRTLAEVLRDGGYSTLAVNDNNSIKTKFNFGQGFDTWIDTGKETAQIVNETLQPLLDPPPNGPWFAYVHYMDPHHPYSAPKPYSRWFNPGYEGEETGEIDKGESDDLGHAIEFYSKNPDRLEQLATMYDNEIAFVDKKIGELFDWLRERGLYDETVILIMADHGEMFLEHGYLKHSRGVYSELIHVPLMLKIPGYGGANRTATHVQTIDIMPTIFDILGIEVDQRLMGQSIFDFIDQPNRPILSENLRMQESRNPQRSVILEEHKLIKTLLSGRFALFNLQEDPGERHDLIDQRQTEVTANELRDLLRRFVIWNEKLGTGLDSVETELDEETIEQLKALGYL